MVGDTARDYCAAVPSEYMRRRPSSPEPESENGKQATGTRVYVDTADAAILPVGDAIPTKLS